MLKSPVTWGLVAGILVLTIKFLDPSVISDHTAEFLVTIIMLITGVLHIPVLTTANAAIARAKVEGRYNQ